MNTIRLTKLDAARRQLDTALDLIFADRDPASIHTLVGAASTIISNLTEKGGSNVSWDRFAQQANKLAPGEYFRIMRAPQNFLKHAESDPDAGWDLDPDHALCLAFWAVMNLGNFGELTMQESVFQLWFLATHAPDLDRDLPPYRQTRSVFGDLRGKPYPEQLAAARRVLAELDV
ncbi:MAG: hypothetical protein JO133_08705 [Burkholderiaceae bacterium]|nr:hypothetical protein [Burkholderiaceae bacterium]